MMALGIEECHLEFARGSSHHLGFARGSSHWGCSVVTPSVKFQCTQKFLLQKEGRMCSSDIVYLHFSYLCYRYLSLPCVIRAQNVTFLKNVFLLVPAML